MAKKASSPEDLLAKYGAKMESEVIKTGIDSIDKVLGGGLTLGYLYGMWGTPGAGKSTVCLQILKNLCKAGHKCAVVDIEKAISKFQVESFKLTEYVENGMLSIFTCTMTNEYEELMLGILNSHEYKVILVDSVTQLAPFVKGGLSVEDVRPGLKSLQLSQIGPKIKSLAYSLDTVVINIYQARANLDMSGNMYAPKDKVAAGFSDKHLVDALIKISVSSRIQDEEKLTIGNKVWIETEKNKFAPPGLRVQSSLIFGQGISRKIDTIDAALEAGLITQGGAVFSLPFDGIKCKGRKALYEMSPENVKRLWEMLQ